MPVPVPPKPSTYPVHKSQFKDNGYSSFFQSLTDVIPVAPKGPPPSFGTRQEWIDSLPSWRRTKPRRIWEDECYQQGFTSGLTVAANASVIKGQPAQACPPPLFTTAPPPIVDDCEIDSPSSPISQCHFESGSQWSASPPEQMSVEVEEDAYERGAFTPIFEERSPGDDSSPIEPVTPFGDFIDRAVAATSGNSPDDNVISTISTDVVPFGINNCGSYDSYREPREPVLPQEIVTPSASTDYKKLAEPLSDWIADYVWKSCTTDISFPSHGLKPVFQKQYTKRAPEYLAPAIHSLLLSTLLQPSAILLALWYTIRLPISFGTLPLTENNDKEARFRMALLGTSHGQASEVMETNAPFRLIVLGCMLANKWLDDHTFSNKTWHTISNIPIHALNHLESLALDIFGYDLNISNAQWSQWLSHIVAYHSSLLGHLQPISRPSANPLSIIRRAIEEIVQAPVASNFDPSRPQPIFLGLEERRKEKLEREQVAVEVAEFDIDEDGPLREEYIPKRRVSGAASTRGDSSRENSHANMEWPRPVPSVKGLPPPAKWSPAGDEPILRDRNRGGVQYVAVQPPPSVPYHVVYPGHDLGFHTQWPTSYVHAPMAMAYAYEVTHHPVPVYGPVAFAIPVSHSRSHSNFTYPDTSDSHNHFRSYSQSHFSYKGGDVRMTTQELSPPSGFGGHWDQPPHAPFTHPSSINYHSAWVGT